jgi:hypothetical protein
VEKLHGARNRASATAGHRIKGAKRMLTDDVLALVKRLHRKNPHTGKRRSLRAIAAELAKAEKVNPKTGKTYSAEAIRLTLKMTPRGSTAGDAGAGEE